MKYDPKAISAAIDAFNERQHILAKSSAPYMQAAISAYCEKAGVVMVPVDPDEQKIALALHDIDDWRGPMREGKNVFRQFARSYIRASQEGN